MHIEEEKLKAMRAQVDAEITERQETHPDVTLGGRFANFLVCLPGMRGKQDFMYDDLKAWDTPHIEISRKFNVTNTMSAIKQIQTPRQFRQSIVEALSDEGITEAEIREFVVKMNAAPDDERLNYFDQLAELTLPGYIRLRAFGYSAYPDLEA